MSAKPEEHKETYHAEMSEPPGWNQNPQDGNNKTKCYRKESDTDYP